LRRFVYERRGIDLCFCTYFGLVDLWVGNACKPSLGFLSRVIGVLWIVPGKSASSGMETNARFLGLCVPFCYRIQKSKKYMQYLFSIWNFGRLKGLVLVGYLNFLLKFVVVEPKVIISCFLLGVRYCCLLYFANSKDW